jgi:hypothetical protein
LQRNRLWYHRPTNEKKADALQNYHIFKFVCSATDYNFFSEAVREKYLLKRGANLKDFVIGLITEQKEDVKGQMMAVLTTI